MRGVRRPENLGGVARVAARVGGSVSMASRNARRIRLAERCRQQEEMSRTGYDPAVDPKSPKGVATTPADADEKATADRAVEIGPRRWSTER